MVRSMRKDLKVGRMLIGVESIFMKINFIDPTLFNKGYELIIFEYRELLIGSFKV